MSCRTASRCYYDILEVDREAETDEIRRQYRKLILQWHPDKNTGQEDLATQRFREVKEAYEVLSDPQERAWYDANRHKILNPGSTSNSTSEENGDVISPLVDLWLYFNSSCYEGFNDEEHGFYSVYRRLFEQIDREEKRYSTSTDKKRGAPNFGTSTSSWAEVDKFYSYWAAYSSEMSFSWSNLYDTDDAPNRQIRRAMETTNKKFRASARKERSGQVRALVKFLYRRDERVAKHLEEEQRRQLEKEQERKEQMEKREEKKKKLQEERIKIMQQVWREQEEHDKEEASQAFVVDDEDEEESGAEFTGRKSKKDANEKGVHFNEEAFEDDDVDNSFSAPQRAKQSTKKTAEIDPAKEAAKIASKRMNRKKQPPGKQPLEEYEDGNQANEESSDEDSDESIEGQGFSTSAFAHLRVGDSSSESSSEAEEEQPTSDNVAVKSCGNKKTKSRPQDRRQCTGQPQVFGSLDVSDTSSEGSTKAVRDQTGSTTADAFNNQNFASKCSKKSSRRRMRRVINHQNEKK